jgi:hypothetical protein
MSIKPVSKLFLPITIALSLLFTATAYAADNTPEGVVKSYYTALKARKYEQAYDLLTPRMIDGRTKKEYTADWKNIVDMGSVILHEYGITSVEIDGETAKVNAWTRASDVFNTKGIIEKEVDHLILIDGIWKLDATEVSMEAVDM